MFTSLVHEYVYVGIIIDENDIHRDMWINAHIRMFHCHAVTHASLGKISKRASCCTKEDFLLALKGNTKILSPKG